LSTTSAY
ncbi:hypothetical protein D037_4929B, partial [Vibrio parahaemolyticus IDH02640]